jgi:hypothetical protein
VNPSGILGNHAINDRGEVSFNASLENGDSGLYVYSRPALHLIAATGTVIPGAGTVSSVAEPVTGAALNNTGQVFFWARMTDGRAVMLVASAKK